MVQLKATIQRDNEGYSIVGSEKIARCYFAGYGDSVEEAKKDFMDGIRESLEFVKERGDDVTVSPDDIEVLYTYDLPSFFNDFDWLNVSAFAKMAGVNESKMRAYKSGVAHASEKTLKKINEAIKTIASTLSAASL